MLNWEEKPQIYFAVFIDGEYTQIITTEATNRKQAKKKFRDAGWNNWIRLEKMIFDKDGISVLYNK